MSDGDGVDLGPFLSFGLIGKGLVESLVDDRKNGFEMGAGGNFGDDAAVGFEDVDLRDDDVAQNGTAVLNNGGGGFIAAGFEGENVHWCYYNREEAKSPARAWGCKTRPGWGAEGAVSDGVGCANRCSIGRI